MPTWLAASPIPSESFISAPIRYTSSRSPSSKASTSRARPVDAFDDGLREEGYRMGALMDDSLGIGLAANQVGILHRVLVYRVEPDSPVQALVNPELEWAGREKELADEGC